jgi:hypothetical protein
MWMIIGDPMSFRKQQFCLGLLPISDKKTALLLMEVSVWGGHRTA